MLRYKTKLDLD